MNSKPVQMSNALNRSNENNHFATPKATKQSPRIVANPLLIPGWESLSF